MRVTALKVNGAGGFTVVELLVVVGVISLLIAILLPSLNKARRQSQAIVCMSNLRQIGLGIEMYENQNRQYLPADFSATLSSTVPGINPATGAPTNYTASGTDNQQDWTTGVANCMGINWIPGKDLPGWTCPSLDLAGVSTVEGTYYNDRPCAYSYTASGSSAYNLALDGPIYYDLFPVTYLARPDEFIMLADAWSTEDKNNNHLYYGYQRQISFRHGSNGIDSCVSGNNRPFPRGFTNTLFADGHVATLDYVTFWNLNLSASNCNSILAHPHPITRPTTTWRTPSPQLTW